MPVQFTVQDSWLATRWAAFLEDNCRAALEAAVLEWPDVQSVTIQFNDLQLRDPDLANTLLEKPASTLRVGADMLNQLDVPVEPRPIMRLRIHEVPDSATYELQALRPELLGRFIAVEGMVRRAGPVYAMIREAAWECRRCTTRIRLVQEDEMMQNPEHCDICETRTPWRLIEEDSSYSAYQKLELQASPEGLRGAGQPPQLRIHVLDDLVRNVAPGDRVRINGILTTQPRRRGYQTSVAFDMVLNAISIEVQESTLRDHELTPGQEASIEALAKDPRRRELFLESFAPNVIGHDEIREALVLCMFGGEAIHHADGTRVRGDIHALLVGDPGVAKSQFLRYICRLAPRAVFTSGKGASAAGLTAAAVKEGNDGQWALEAGALVMADRGIACIDELDKMDRKDQSSMHQAMEQQEISIAKAGVLATFNSRCAVIGAANPKMGRFDEYEALHAQINMPPALLSRFDLIFSIIDKPHKERDTFLAETVLRRQFVSALLAQTRRAGKDPRVVPAFPGMDREALQAEAAVPIEPDLFRAYITYAKTRVFPVVPPEVNDLLRDRYVQLRCSGDGAVPVTARQLEGLTRLAQAAARWRLSPEVAREDAEMAIRVQLASLQSVGVDPDTGAFDIDRIATGRTHSQHDRMRIVEKIVRELQADSKRGSAMRDDVVRLAARQDMDAAACTKAIEQGLRDGIFYAPHGGNSIAALWGR